MIPLARFRPAFTRSRWEPMSNLCRKLKWKSTDQTVTPEAAASLFQSPSFLNNMSQLLPGEERIRASTFEIDIGKELEYPRTVYEALQVASENNTATRHICGWIDQTTKKLRFLSYEQFFEQTKQVSMALHELGIRPKDCVALNFANSKDFLVSMYGATSMSMILQPLYASLDARAIRSILRQGTPSIYIVDSEAKARVVVERSSQVPFVKTLVVSGAAPSRELRTDANSAGIQLLSMKDFRKLGENKSHPLLLPDPSDVFGLVYTSGTTGDPKGAVVTHNRLMRAYHTLSVLQKAIGGRPGEYMFSFLPTGHIYELMFEVLCLANGGTPMFWRGNIRELGADLKIIRPQIIPMVPRIMNRLYDEVQKVLNKNYLKRLIFDIAYRRKKALLMLGENRHDTIYDRFVFKGIREALGGRAKFIVTASAPLSSVVLEFFKVTCGCSIVEVYGSTEATIITTTSPFDVEGGHLGGPLPAVEIKLVDVPDLGFFSKDDIGEIYVRSPYMCRCYHNNERITNEVFKEGWLATGDIGRWNSKGQLIIVDRQKDIFKLAQGEYIAPEMIEAAYSRVPIVQDVFVDGNSERSFCVAIVVPQKSAFLEWADQQGLVAETKPVMAHLCEDRRVRRAFLEELREKGEELGLTKLQQVQNVYLVPEPFTTHSGILASTYKLKRSVARKKFAQAIEAMYREGSLLNGEGDKTHN